MEFMYLDPPSTLYYTRNTTIRDHIPLFKGTRRVLVGALGFGLRV